MNIVEEFRKNDIFSGLSGIALSRLSAGCVIRTIESDHTLFREGDGGEAFFMLLSGSLRVYKHGPEGREITVKLLKTGEIFGEVILFERDTYPATCIALEHSSVIVIRRQVFRELLTDPEFAGGFYGVLMGKLRYLNDRLVYLSALDVEERFFRFLEENWGRSSSYTVEMSKKDIASAIGTIPETFSRMLARLKKAGLITWEEPFLRVADAAWEYVDAED